MTRLLPFVVLVRCYNEEDILQEFLDYYLFKLKVDKVIILNTGDKNIVVNHKKVFIWNLPHAKFIKESEALTEMYMSIKFDCYLAIFDLDEFLVFSDDWNIDKFVNELINREIFEYKVNWAIVGDCKQKFKTEGNLFKRFPTPDYNSIHNKKTKLILRSMKPIKRILTHECLSDYDLHSSFGNFKELYYRGKTTDYPDYSICQLNHFATKSQEEYVEKCRRRNRSAVPMSGDIGYSIWKRYNRKPLNDTELTIRIEDLQETSEESDQKSSEESDQKSSEESDQKSEQRTEESLKEDSDPKSDQKFEQESKNKQIQKIEESSDQNLKEESDPKSVQSSVQSSDQKSLEELEKEIEEILSQNLDQISDQETDQNSSKELKNESDQSSDQSSESKTDQNSSKELKNESDQNLKEGSDPETDQRTEETLSQNLDQTSVQESKNKQIQKIETSSDPKSDQESSEELKNESDQSFDQSVVQNVVQTSEQTSDQESSEELKNESDQRTEETLSQKSEQSSEQESKNKQIKESSEELKNESDQEWLSDFEDDFDRNLIEQ